MYALGRIDSESKKVSDVCVKIHYRDTEISVHFDDSCGAMDKLGRCDIRIYGGWNYEANITDIIQPKNKQGCDIYPDGIKTIVWIKRKIDRAYKLGLLPVSSLKPT